MRLGRLLASVLVSALLGCAGAPAAGKCDGVLCGPGLRCSPTSGRCVVIGANASGAGSGQGGGAATGGGTALVVKDAGAACAMSCSGVTPICDVLSKSCRACTETQGCSGATPVCNPVENGGFGRCVACTLSSGCGGGRPFCDPGVYPFGACRACLSALDCAAGLACDAEGTCVADDGGFGGGGGQVRWDEGGFDHHCLSLDAGAPARCSGECPRRGFVCIDGQCALRGHDGPVQVTLRWPDDEDVDLHVVEPLADAGSCEVWYGVPNLTPLRPIPNLGCGANGRLDLESNAACTLDSTRIENVVWPAGLATAGKYAVRVDYYQRCLAVSAVPWEVEVRVGGQTRYYCGEFQPDQADQGAANSGLPVTTFTLQ